MSFAGKTCLSTLVAFVLTSMGCAGGQSGEPDDGLPPFAQARSALARETAPVVSMEDRVRQADGNRAFALDMYLQLVGEHPADGLFFSPYSISVALAMTYAGAAGTTAEEMAMALHFALEEPTLHQAFNAVDLALSSRGKGATGQDGEPFRLNVVNSLWGRPGAMYLQPFLDTLAVNYGAGLRLVDFADAPDQSRRIINKWVAEQTERRIDELLPMGSIDASALLVLVNAVYFNAAWEAKFSPESTADAAFTTLDGRALQVPTMNIIDSLGYYSGAGVQAVEKRYDGGELTMVLIVPDDLSSFEASLDAAGLQTILAGLKPSYGGLHVPKWRYEGDSISLVQVFKALGMQEAFTDAADFSRLVEGGGPQIGDIFHQAFVAVDENGTEAAAATGVVIVNTSAPPNPQFDLLVDRPFIYLIRDVATDTIVFMGRVTDPS